MSKLNFESEGILKFDLKKITKKHNEQTWKKTAMVIISDDLSNYYAYYLKQRFGLSLIKPLRGSHVTIINDKISEETFLEAEKIFNNKTISFEYFPEEIKGNGLHWYLPVKSKHFENVRTTIGLESIPYYNFHLTIGMVNNYNLNHSEYILQIMKNFNL